MDVLALALCLLVSIYWLVIAILNWRKKKYIQKMNEFALKNIKKKYLEDFENREMTDTDFREIMTSIFLGEVKIDNNQAMEEIIEKLFG